MSGETLVHPRGIILKQMNGNLLTALSHQPLVAWPFANSLPLVWSTSWWCNDRGLGIAVVTVIIVNIRYTSYFMLGLLGV